MVTVKKSTTKEVVSSIRVRGKTYQPKVLELGSYEIEIGEGNTPVTFFEVPSAKKNSKVLNVTL